MKIALESGSRLRKAKARGPTARGPTNNSNNNRAFVGGNPAMTAKRLRQGVKETLKTNVVGEKGHGSQRGCVME